tara:strand:+ start:308 stop:520 length:213 start_codon:yes stop_codon:yes gene_type:complete
VETRVLKQAVRSNLKRFLEDFMFQLSKEVWKELITNCDSYPRRLNNATAKRDGLKIQGYSAGNELLITKR